jgi:hypothetical protein
MENYFFCLTPDPSPIGEGSTSAGLYGSSLGGAFRLGFPAKPRKRASFPVSGKGRGWGIGGEMAEIIVANIGT